MLDWITGLTSLPNLHPALVHFPLGLLPVASSADLAALVTRRAWWDRAATFLYACGTLGAWAALRAGERASDGLTGVPPRLQPAIAQHSDWAHYTLYLFAAVAVARLLLCWRDRRRERLGGIAGRALVLAAALVGVGLLARTADLGGALVYRHGLAVATYRDGAEAAVAQRPAEKGGPVASGEGGAGARGEGASGSAAKGFDTAPDGSLRWSPGPGDADALGSVLTSAEGAGAVRAVADPVGPGLALDVDGRALLLLPGSFGDVQVDVTFELAGFEGAVGVAHHATATAQRAGLFVVSTEGRAELLEVSDGRREVLDAAEARLPAGPFLLGVSAAGRHLRGLLDGATLAHGHRAAPPPGACGILLDGRGTVRILEARITALQASGA